MTSKITNKTKRIIINELEMIAIQIGKGSNNTISISNKRNNIVIIKNRKDKGNR